MKNFDLPQIYDSLTWAQRWVVKEQYIDEQHGKCCHCQSALNRQPPELIMKKRINWSLFPKGFRQYPIHLHHCHKTGLTIGVVHNYCNAILWQYHDE